jgi:glycosyltransferase involved in cell wall biosynthesis
VPSGRREQFFLMPGRIMWTKNLELGIRAFTELKARPAPRDDGRSLRLVVAGMVDAKSERYFGELQRLAMDRTDIEFIRNPTDEVLFDLYDRCHSVLFTPLNEDWGIVPLESMAFGKPVISVDRGGPTESILHGRSGLLCAPAVPAFAAAMEMLLDDEHLYQRMSQTAREWAQQFHWDTFVRRIDDGIERPVAATLTSSPAVGLRGSIR